MIKTQPARGKVIKSPPFYLRSGNFSVSIASRPDEIDELQALRYEIFFREMGARPSRAASAMERDIDRFDEAADHLIVVDHGADKLNKMVATCRLLRCSAASNVGGFYSAGEYDIRCIQKYPGRVLELGRSCVDADYRHRSVMQLLWRGIAAYIFYYEIDLMFGCASLPSNGSTEIASQLSVLYHYYLAPLDLRPSALTHLRVEMRLIEAHKLRIQQVVSRLPPLVKGYLRLGGFVGDGAVIDIEFNTTDVIIIVKTDFVARKYFRHYANI